MFCVYHFFYLIVFGWLFHHTTIMPLLAGERLNQSVKASLALCGAEGNRSYMLIRDECVYAKSWSLMYGLKADCPEKPICVGGRHPECSMMLWSEEDGFTDLEAEKLADVCVCTVMKGLDSRGPCFQIQQMPRSRTTSKEEEFHQFGLMIQTCMDQNMGRPPSAVSFDNHGSFALVNAALLGLLDDGMMQGVPFFQDCLIGEKLPVPCFPCRVLKHQGVTPIFGVNDPLHVQKAQFVHTLSNKWFWIFLIVIGQERADICR